MSFINKLTLEEAKNLLIKLESDNLIEGQRLDRQTAINDALGVRATTKTLIEIERQHELLKQLLHICENTQKNQ